MAAILTGCGLPRSGPTRQEILSASTERRGDAHIIEVTDEVVRATTLPPGFGFDGGFTQAGVIASDTIAPGDVLSITVWENVEQGVLSAAGGGATVLSDVQVDGQGFIFMPYAGRLRAAGNSPEALRRIITRQLETQTPDPQVLVTRQAGDGATVSIVGNVGGQGVYPIERPTRTLTAMLAAAGGVSVEPEITRITVLRDGQSGTVWLSDLYSNPVNDIALRPGDRILIEEDTRAYTALGATGGQRRVTFDSQDLSALDAITQAGGLNSSIADPTGVFVFRDEPAAIANAVLGRSDLYGSVRMIYLLDLTKPSGIFVARDFVIRDEDTIYVTEAPFTQWQKIIGAITGTAGSVNSLANVADGSD
jgi:polysaccharide export outer membrane protein